MESTDGKDVEPTSLQTVLALLSSKERGAVVGVIEGKKEGRSLTVPDYHIRHKYLETILKVIGAFAPQKHEEVTDTYEDRLRRLRDKHKKTMGQEGDAE